MAENYERIEGSKELQYEQVFQHAKFLLENETDIIANTANICALLKMQFDFLWVGFYFIKNNELVLGPFQGPVACTRIARGRGVCGKAWERAEVIIVDDVELFDGHIACSSLSKSEIVIPFSVKNQLFGVLDVDSENLSSFDEIDALYLAKILNLLY